METAYTFLVVCRDSSPWTFFHRHLASVTLMAVRCKKEFANLYKSSSKKTPKKTEMPSTITGLVKSVLCKFIAQVYKRILCVLSKQNIYFSMNMEETFFSFKGIAVQERTVIKSQSAANANYRPFNREACGILGNFLRFVKKALLQ